jgi:hypothetical protein
MLRQTLVQLLAERVKNEDRSAAVSAAPLDGAEMRVTEECVDKA